MPMYCTYVTNMYAFEFSPALSGKLVHHLVSSIEYLVIHIENVLKSHRPDTHTHTYRLCLKFILIAIGGPGFVLSLLAAVILAGQLSQAAGL